MSARPAPGGCSHPGSPHRHGSRDAYVVDGCRCAECRRANARSEQDRRRQIAYGRWQPFIDATPVREHLRALGIDGIGLRRVAELSGVPYSTLASLMYSVRRPPGGRRVRRETARRVLAVRRTTGAPAGGTRVAALGTRRRIQALVAIGWTLTALAEHLDRDVASLRHSLHRETVTTATARAVTALYERLWNTRPDEPTPAYCRRADGARAMARARGWRPPMDWEDIDTDADSGPPAPSYELDERDVAILTDRLCSGEHVVVESQLLRDEIIWQLTSRGYSLTAIANLLAITTRTVSRRRRAGRAA